MGQICQIAREKFSKKSINMKLLKCLAITTVAFAAYTDTCNGSGASNCDGTCSSQFETCQGGSGLVVSDYACCSNADADFVCSGANPTVPGIPTDAPVEPTASSTMAST